MATKIIKFDLQMKGVKVTNFDELQDNFSADILPIFQTGRLAKWLMSRELVAQSEAIAAIDKNSTELQQLAFICRVLELDDDEEVLQFLLDDRQVVEVAQTAVSIPVVEVCDVDVEDVSTPLLSGVDWSGQDMSGRHFIGEDFRNANLKNTNFMGADLTHADFTGADLSGANLTGAKLNFANFSDANLSHANLSYAFNITNKYEDWGGKTDDQLISIIRNNEKHYVNNAYGVHFSDEINFTKSNLTNATLDFAIFYCAIFREADLTKASLINTYLYSARLDDANLSFADLKDASFASFIEGEEEVFFLYDTKLTGAINYKEPKGW